MLRLRSTPKAWQTLAMYVAEHCLKVWQSCKIVAVYLLKALRFARIGDQPCDQRDVNSIKAIEYSALSSPAWRSLRKILYLQDVCRLNYAAVPTSAGLGVGADGPAASARWTQNDPTFGRTDTTARKPGLAFICQVRWGWSRYSWLRISVRRDTVR